MPVKPKKGPSQLLGETIVEFGACSCAMRLDQWLLTKRLAVPGIFDSAERTIIY